MLFNSKTILHHYLKNGKDLKGLNTQFQVIVYVKSGITLPFKLLCQQTRYITGFPTRIALNSVTYLLCFCYRRSTSYLQSNYNFQIENGEILIVFQREDSRVLSDRSPLNISYLKCRLHSLLKYFKIKNILSFLVESV